jgi:hypothetical protein
LSAYFVTVLNHESKPLGEEWINGPHLAREAQACVHKHVEPRFSLCFSLIGRIESMLMALRSSHIFREPSVAFDNGHLHIERF